MHRSDSDFESIPGQRGLGTRRHGERVHEVTECSLQRVGPFFAGRNDTTVLHCVRRMEDRAAWDPEFLAYMASIKQARPVGGLPPPSKTRAPHAGVVVFSRGASAAVPRMFRSHADEKIDSRRSVGDRLASSPSTWAQFLVRAVAGEPSCEKRRRGGWLPLRARPRRQGCVAGSRAFRAPLQRDRLAVGGQGRGEAKPKAIEPSSCAQTRGADMTGHDPEIEDLRHRVHCAVVLERTRAAVETGSEGEHETQPEVPARQRRNPDRQPCRTRMVGSDQRRQRRRLRAGAEARARHELRPRPQAPARIRRIVAALPTRRKGRVPKYPR